MRDFHFTQRIDNSRVVRVEDPRRRREQRLLLAAVSAVCLLLFGYAWQNFQSLRLGYQVEGVRRQQAGLRQWNRELRLEQAALRDPIRIYALAHQRLGLQSAQPGQWVRLTQPPVPAVEPGPVMAEAQLPRAVPREVSRAGPMGRR
ncbi:MAG: cell division protein FtsL [Terriglobales bacterium]